VGWREYWWRSRREGGGREEEEEVGGTGNIDIKEFRGSFWPRPTPSWEL